MWKALLALSSLIASLQISKAVRCWKCDNALDNDDCIDRGQSVECTGESGGCFAEIRYHWGLIPPIRITKRCKQGHACDNNVFQNDEGAHPFQCNPRLPESICRCCCETDDCNRPELGCLPAYPDCRTLVVPANGGMTCKYDAIPPSIGETCEFTCNRGYELVGARVLVCGPVNARISRWNHREPTCNPLTCNPEYTTLQNGQVDCTRRNFVGSICTFQCSNGYVMDGHERAECFPSQNWDNQPPKCIPITCTPPMIPPTFGKVECNNQNKLNSVCRFTCEDGYQLLGAPSSVCNDDGNGDRFGRWSSPVPRCGKLMCQPQSRNPTNGKVDCTNVNFGGSVCSYECNGKFSIVGAQQRVCQDDGDGDEMGRWSDREPTCQRIRCTPSRNSPQNGQVTCSDQNFLGSKCTYTCNDGYTLTPSSSRVTECVDDGDGDAKGEWSQPPPVCSPGECNPVMTNPINGLVQCSDGNSVRSVCRFTCDEGYYMRSAGGMEYPIASLDVICRRDNTWSQQQPTCEPITCEPPHRDTDTKIVSCTDSNNYRSVCTWECRNGDPIVGETQSTCLDNQGSKFGRWSPANPVNICKGPTCQPPQISPQNGAVTCTDGNNALSTCTFTCKPGYYMLTGSSQPVANGQHSIDCRRDGAWSELPPTCEPIVCLPKQSNPDYGSVSCSLDNRYQSVCRFRCIEGYELVGPQSVECLDSAPGDRFGDWSENPPICQPAQCVPPLVTPAHGAMTCSNGASFGSVCTFTCGEGYYMLSSSDDAITSNRYESLCKADGTWSNPEPTCEPIFCLPEQTAPRHGDVSCTDSNNYRSRCTFSCNSGYQPSTTQVTTDCLDDENGDAVGYWSHPMPKCVPRSCSPPQTNPANGRVSCTDGSNYGSVCTFRCNDCYYQSTAAGDLVRSNDMKTECLSSNEWSTQPPTCRPIRCIPIHTPPKNGRVSCPNGNLCRSSCTFGCDPGYEVIGSSKSTCTDDGNGDEDGEWSSPAPVCEPTTCNPPLSAPNNGIISCTNENVFGSTCSFACNEGYYMISGSRPVLSNNLESVCGPGRKWSRPAPTCRPITCVPPHRRPANGEFSCTNRNFYRSECTFRCNAGYVITPGLGGSPPIDNSIVSFCGEDSVPGDANGEWTEPPPTCEPDSCARLDDPENGQVSCSNGFLLASTCTYTCNRGYYMAGPDGTITARNLLRTVCTPAIIWSVGPPTCRPITCLPVHADPLGGSVSCTNENFHGSTCTFTCDRGYELIGRPRTRCEQTPGNSQYGEWSNPAPTCKENLCDETLPLTPDRGIMSCSNRNVLGSVCTFTCDRFHSRVGPAASTCIETPEGPRWSHGTPTCEPDLCQPPRETLRNGVVSCTRENFVNSECTFTCTTPTYELYPEGITINKCTASKSWNQRAPCCTRPCPPNARMDAVVVLDSSSSVGRANWRLMTAFIRGILASFTISEDTSHFSVIRYNRAVDTRNQILFNDYPTDKAGLLAAFDQIPYDGSGTRTGQAIKYAGDVLMTPENGDRPGVPNILIVVTDGRSQDNVLPPSEALRRRGVITFAIGIRPPRGNLDEDQLVEIAGARSNVLIAEDFSALDTNFALRITDKVCGDPCDQ